jgi:hypothetical protein
MGDPQMQSDRERLDAADVDPLGAAEAHLVDTWIRPALGDVVVAFAAPPISGAGGPPSIHLTLLDTVPATAARATHQPGPLQLRARFLVTASAPTQGEADRAIVALAFAALATGTPELEREPPGADLWPAIGFEARPSLVIRTLLELERHVPLARRVRKVVTHWVPRRPLTGRVVGPEDIPIAGALIEVEGMGLTAYSNHRGEFRLVGVPVGPPVPTLVVTAKGTRLTLPAESPAGQSLLIRVPLPES